MNMAITGGGTGGKLTPSGLGRKPLPTAPFGQTAPPSLAARLVELAPELPFADIWTPEPPLSLVVPALGICPGPVHLITGSWYTGKTLFLMAIGLAVASGRDLFGLYGVRRGLWVHLDYEMGRRSAKRYLGRLAGGLGLLPADLEGRVSLRVLPRLNLCTADAEDLYCEMLQGVSVCTLDPLRAAAPGQDENSSEFRQWLDMLARVSNRTDCAIFVLHHGGKPVEGAARRNTGRGSSAIDDAVQSKFVLTAAEKGAPIQVSHEKTRELPALLEDFWLELVNEPEAVRLVHRGDEEMEASSALREAHARRGRVEKGVAQVVSYFESNSGCVPLPVKAIRSQVGLRSQTFEEAWAELQKLGRLKREGSRDDVRWVLR